VPGLGGPEFDGALLQRVGEEPAVVAQVDGFAGEHIPLGDATGERDGLEAEGGRGDPDRWVFDGMEPFGGNGGGPVERDADPRRRSRAKRRMDRGR